MDVEFQRMKDRMEMLSTILDDMHVSESWKGKKGVIILNFLSGKNVRV